MKINAKDIQRLRESTSCGVMDCKQALEQSQGDFDRALEVLRQKGRVTAQKKAARRAEQGLIGCDDTAIAGRRSSP